MIGNVTQGCLHDGFHSGDLLVLEIGELGALSLCQASVVLQAEIYE